MTPRRCQLTASCRMATWFLGLGYRCRSPRRLGSLMNENEELLAYFERLSNEQPDSQYSIGAAMTREWLVLQHRGSVSQTEFDSFLQRLEDIESPGSGYYDLWIRVRHWAYEGGLEVPNDHPWRNGRRYLACNSVEGFADQLTIGKKYRKLKTDEGRQLVRICNNQGKHRWYPYSCFEPESQTDRPRVRKEDGT